MYHNTKFNEITRHLNTGVLNCIQGKAIYYIH